MPATAIPAMRPRAARAYHSREEDPAMIRVSMLFASLALVLALAPVRPAEADDKPTPTQEELDKQFAELMSGATLVGRFTLGEQQGDKPLSEDRYTLGKVYKLKNGLWSFETRIQYGGKDVKVPLALEVKWAGSTPVITLDNVLVPGLGTFTSRVLIYGHEYAGTWSGGDHGGHMYGKIVPAGAAEQPAADK
jgi:hypothetical protein